MKQHWDKFVRRVDGISLRERALIFLAIAAVLVAAIKPVFFDPLLKQKGDMAAMVAQREGKLRDIQERITAATQARTNDANSPQRKQLAQTQKQIEDGKAYIQSIKDKLVPPDEMVDLLKKVLKKYDRLELVALDTQPVKPLTAAKAEGDATAAGLDKQVFKHGVTLTIRGSYPDLMQYLTELKALQTQMFWTDATMKASGYPAVDLTVTLYTLSLDKSWLQI